MSDLISRQAAIDALTHKWDGMVTSVFDVLKELPSAEPERKTGQWIIDDEGMLHCSECTKIPTNRIRDCFKVLYDIHPLKMNYCPTCGAEMRGGEDG